MDVLKNIIILIVCHLIGDYVLQSDFIAKTKGDNFYHLLVHCALYTFPFCFVVSGWRILVFVFGTHIIIDTLKSWKMISYVADQIAHYIVLGIVFWANAVTILD